MKHHEIMYLIFQKAIHLSGVSPKDVEFIPDGDFPYSPARVRITDEESPKPILELSPLFYSTYSSVLDKLHVLLHELGHIKLGHLKEDFPTLHSNHTCGDQDSGLEKVRCILEGEAQGHEDALDVLSKLATQWANDFYHTPCLQCKIRERRQELEADQFAIKCLISSGVPRHKIIESSINILPDYTLRFDEKLESHPTGTTRIRHILRYLADGG